MVQIDIDADLNMVDDDDRHFARVPKGAAEVAVGAIVVAGRPGFWSWVRIDEIDGSIAFFHQISAREAAENGELSIAAQP